VVKSQLLTIPKAIKKAKKAIKQGNISAAQQLYNAVLKHQPNHPVAKKGLRRLKKCLPSNQSVQAQPTNPLQDQINLLIKLYNSGQMKNAEQACKQLLQTCPQSLIVYNILGAAFQGQGKLQNAVQAFDKVIQYKPSDAEAHNNRGAALRGLGQLEEAVKSYDKAIQLKPDFVEANYNRGNALRDLGQLEEAVKSYDKAIQLKPDYANAYSNRGNALRDLGQLEEAVTCFDKAIQLNPDNHSAQHMINSILGHDSDSTPREYVENLFNRYAKKFEHNLVDKLEYKMPSLLKKTLSGLDLVNKKLNKAVDLGCGTGLAGVAFRNIVNTLVGIDLSKEMIHKAEEKNVYDNLIVNDIISGLQSLDTNFDLFISSDVFIYVGDLRPLFGSVKKYANNRSLFVFSTEDTNSDNFHLRKTGRFAHSKDYVLSIASDYGFKLEHFERSNLRKQKGIWIVGGIYILRNE